MRLVVASVETMTVGVAMIAMATGTAMATGMTDTIDEMRDVRIEVRLVVST